MSPFAEGLAARQAGATSEANPYIIGRTKLGAPRFSEQGLDWLAGYSSWRPAASAEEIAAATRATDLGQFRSRHRRHR